MPVVNPFVWFILAAAGLVFLVFVAQSRSVKRLREGVEAMARDMGWSEVKVSSFLFIGVRGIWNGYNVRIRRIPRQKSIPERLIATIRVQAPARIIITRRQRGIFGGRPL